MAKVSIKGWVHASADEVWKTISDFETVGEYVPGITKTASEGNNVGAIRTLTMVNGGRVVERLESLDEKSRTLQYSVLSTPLPMKGYLSTMKLTPLGGNKCELLWESTFKVTKGRQAAVEKIISRLYMWGIEGLNNLHRS
ncbi:MAG: SRPBCC family protein [Candidatus Omnitrophica bacterium]|nr:SRPBCC family protein [Candidatus Omnitrophota bacterium]